MRRTLPALSFSTPKFAGPHRTQAQRLKYPLLFAGCSAFVWFAYTGEQIRSQGEAEKRAAKEKSDLDQQRNRSRKNLPLRPQFNPKLLVSGLQKAFAEDFPALPMAILALFFLDFDLSFISDVIPNSAASRLLWSNDSDEAQRRDIRGIWPGVYPSKRKVFLSKTNPTASSEMDSTAPKDDATEQDKSDQDSLALNHVQKLKITEQAAANTRGFPVFRAPQVNHPAYAYGRDFIDSVWVGSHPFIDFETVRSISRADLWAIAAGEAFVALGGPQLPMFWGRKDTPQNFNLQNDYQQRCEKLSQVSMYQSRVVIGDGESFENAMCSVKENRREISSPVSGAGIGSFDPSVFGTLGPPWAPQGNWDTYFQVGAFGTKHLFLRNDLESRAVLSFLDRVLAHEYQGEGKYDASDLFGEVRLAKAIGQDWVLDPSKQLKPPLANGRGYDRTHVYCALKSVDQAANEGKDACRAGLSALPFLTVDCRHQAQSIVDPSWDEKNPKKKASFQSCSPFYLNTLANGFSKLLTAPNPNELQIVN